MKNFSQNENTKDGSPLNSSQTLKEQIFAILYKFFKEYKNKKYFLCDTSITLMSKSEDSMEKKMTGQLTHEPTRKNPKPNISQMNPAKYYEDYNIMTKLVYPSLTKLIYNRISVHIIHHINRLTL